MTDRAALDPSHGTRDHCPMKRALTLLSALMLIGCRGEAGAPPAPAPPTADAAPAATPAATPKPPDAKAAGAEPAPEVAKTAAHVHGAGHVPPIDCPLAAAGIDPMGLQPFDKVDEYIAFLERADRAQWQRPDEVVAALGLTGKEHVTDVGAGSGYFTFRLSKALPQGEVRAVDVSPEMVRHVHHKAMTGGVDNVQAVLVDPDDPGVTADSDLVFLCDVLHHVAAREAWFKRLHDAMKPGARLALIEFKQGDLPQGPPEGLKIPRADLVTLAEGAGFRLVEDKPDVLPYQVFLIFERL